MNFCEFSFLPREKNPFFCSMYLTKWRQILLIFTSVKFFYLILGLLANSILLKKIILKVIVRYCYKKGGGWKNCDLLWKSNQRDLNHKFTCVVFHTFLFSLPSIFDLYKNIIYYIFHLEQNHKSCTKRTLNDGSTCKVKMFPLISIIRQDLLLPFFLHVLCRYYDKAVSVKYYGN